MSKFTEGVCGDGAGIMRDGELLTISEILDLLNRCKCIELRTHLDGLFSASLHFSDSLEEGGDINSDGGRTFYDFEIAIGAVQKMVSDELDN